MNEMVERVARAIYEHSHEPSMRWEDSAHQPAWCLAARYAIQALPVFHVEQLGWDLKLQADGSWKRIR